jgi:threonine dehydrogenase-like Zn-dependent dehydrogenase
MPSYTASHINTWQALKLLESGTIELQNIITDTFVLEEAIDAFRMAESREGLKILIVNKS